MLTHILACMSLFRKLFCCSPDYSFLKVFGCTAYPLTRPYNKNKFDFRTIRCVSFGYISYHHVYICLHKQSQHTYFARYVRFNKESFLSTKTSILGRPPFMAISPWIVILSS